MDRRQRRRLLRSMILRVRRAQGKIPRHRKEGLLKERTHQRKKGHHSLLPDLPDGDGRAAGPDGGMYASLVSSTTAAEMTPATGYAGGRGLLDRAQPVVADLHRRDGPGPDAEVLSEGWSELSSA